MTDWHAHPGPEFHLLYAELRDRLQSVQGLAGGIYLGAATSPPTDREGRVLPYVVLWPGAGVPLQDNDVSGRTYQAAQRAEFTTTMVGGVPDWVLRAARDVSNVLTDALGGRVKPVELQQQAAVLQQSQAERPVRYFIPLTWTVTDHF